MAIARINLNSRLSRQAQFAKKRKYHFGQNKANLISCKTNSHNDLRVARAGGQTQYFGLKIVHSREDKLTAEGGCPTKKGNSRSRARACSTRTSLTSAAHLCYI